jgi:RimJ/RimL family protein N-acetyltransferase
MLNTPSIHGATERPTNTMNRPRIQKMLAQPPKLLQHEGLQLEFEKIVPGDESRSLVPFYHFKIKNCDYEVVGHINFRVGDSNHVRQTAGHIGFEILPKFRGRSYAYQACLALRSFARQEYDKVVLTAAPENSPSIRIIEKLGAKFIDEVEVAVDDPAYLSGARRKVRYEWAL